MDRRQLLIPAVAAVVIAGDQVAKTWALRSLTPYTPRHVAGPSYFLLSFNGGAAFSLGRGITPIVETVVVVLVVWLLLASRRMARRASIPMSIGLGMLLGGALGNLADRVFRHIPHYPGAVVDFIQAVSWWPIFNVADACIVVGVIVLVLTYRRAPGV